MAWTPFCTTNKPPYLYDRMPSIGGLDSPSAALGLIVGSVVRLGLLVEHQFIGTRLTGQGPLQRRRCSHREATVIHEGVRETWVTKGRKRQRDRECYLRGDWECYLRVDRYLQHHHWGNTLVICGGCFWSITLSFLETAIAVLQWNRALIILHNFLFVFC